MVKIADYLNSNTRNILVTEAGFSRVLQKLKGDTYATISAYRNQYDKKTNIQRNRDLRGEFNKRKMGVYPLVGYWLECQLEGVSYEDCPKEHIVEVIERSYLVVKRDDQTDEEFKELIIYLTKRFDQDGAVLAMNGKYYVVEPSGNSFHIGNNLTLYKIGQAYSRYVKKMDIPFMFEAEIPGSNIGRQIFQSKGLLYPVGVTRDEMRSLTEVIDD